MNPLRVPRSPVVPPPPPGAAAGHQDLRDPGERGQVPPRAGKGRDHPSPRGARGSGRPTGAPGGAAASGGSRGGAGNGVTGLGAALYRSRCPPRPRDVTGDSAPLLAGLAAVPPPGVPGTPLGCGGRPASRGCAARLGASPAAAGAEHREHDGHRHRGHRHRGLAGLEPRGGLAAPARAGGEVGVAGAAAAAAPRLRPRTPLVLPTAPRPPQPRAQPGELLLGRGFHGHLPAGPPARLPGQHRRGAGGAARHAAVPPARVHPGHGLFPGAGAGAGDAGAARAGRASRGVAGAAAQRFLHPGRGSRPRRPGGLGGARCPRGAAGRGAGAGAGAARGAGGAGAGAARRGRGGAAGAAGAAAAQGRRGLRPLAGAAAEPPAPARRGLVPGAAGPHVPAGRRGGHGAGGGRGAEAAPVPGRAGGLGGRHLPLRHLPGDSAPGAGGAAESHPQGDPDPRRLRVGQRHPLRQGMRSAGICAPASEDPVGFLCPEVPKCLSQLCASVSLSNLSSFSSPTWDPPFSLPPCTPLFQSAKVPLSALCLSFPVCTRDRCCDPPSQDTGRG